MGRFLVFYDRPSNIGLVLEQCFFGKPEDLSG